MKITVLAGGVGGAKFLRGLRQHLRQALPDGAGGTTAEVTVVVNTGDDLWLTGLRVCPDLDSIMYTLGGGNDEVRGWGRLGESERVSAELTAYGVGWPWFTLGDLDLGTHITRSHLLREGRTLSEATAEVTARWNLGVTLVPMSDQPVETHVVVADASSDTGTRTMHFEEWWVRYRASLPALRFEQHGLESAVAAPGVVDAILGADVVLVAPSNPVVSIGTILPVPGIRTALQQTGAPVVGVSPIISGSPVRGMAKACLDAIGVEVAADAVAHLYGSREVSGSAGRGILDAWLVDQSDEALVAGIEAAGIRVSVVPLWMTTVDTSAALAAAALDAAGTLTR
ncbi:2-phospho-L-lactate transferase [Subtercola boreus]|uniref:2-phospho-L-lactate transferase n=1 Tax=Subtercola boreus TaxID=120213 RepID=A0A3E0WEL2_9MICO|nr:2-phospho-L-lactate transferase [Subtercola boreus]RFA22399.1 2-phospho-L-lactate transferase [Subtercola boreus]RFA22461.1 2-phospho-L-lactate transferase [Subtercola boreus]RFA28476.1 2-phospho-L-lactate transferase [Subtercola boreus]